MGRRSIVLLLVLAVLLQPAFAVVCTAPCAPISQPQAQPISEHAAHAHHHAMTAANNASHFMGATGMCNKTVDLRSSAVIPPAPTFALAVYTETVAPVATSSVVALPNIARDSGSPPPIVVPLRI